MNFALSPSAIKTFQKCPYQFFLKYIEGSLPYTQSEAAARGDRLHKAMEQSLVSRQFVWPEPATERVARSFFATCEKLRRAGWELHVEAEAATTRGGTACAYKAKPPTNFLRSRIDLYATHPDHDFVIVIDWKTGKVWELDTVQLVVNALCLQALTGRRKYRMCFAYLDQDKIVEHSLDVPLVPFDEYDKPQVDTHFAGLYWTIHNIAACEADGQWPQKPNRFCRWCGSQSCAVL